MGMLLGKIDVNAYKLKPYQINIWDIYKTQQATFTGMKVVNIKYSCFD